MEQKTSFLGHTIAYDSSAHDGLYYLIHAIDAQEAKVFFDQAHNIRGFAFFEDQKGYNYKLIHSGGEYQLVKL